jgi:hypothetical protein
MKHHQIEVDHMTEKTPGHGIVTTSKIHAGGDVTPVEPLQSSNAVAALGASSDWGAGPIRGFLDIAGTEVRVGGANGTSGSSAILSFVAANAVKMKLSAAGCLGINDSSPVYTLDVADGGSGTSYTFGACITAGAGRSALMLVTSGGTGLAAYVYGGVTMAGTCSAHAYVET